MESHEPHSDEGVLHSKYRDYRSGQLASFFVYMSPDDIYAIVQRSVEESGEAGEITYKRMVELATDWLDGWVPLPPFEVWVEDYRVNPSPYEEYFLGLWKSP